MNNAARGAALAGTAVRRPGSIAAFEALLSQRAAFSRCSDDFSIGAGEPAAPEQCAACGGTGGHDPSRASEGGRA